MSEETKGEAVETATPEAGEENKDAEQTTEEPAADADGDKGENKEQEAAPIVPEKYSIAIPDGSQVTDDFLLDRSQEYKRLGLTDEQAKSEWNRDVSVAEKQWKMQIDKYEAEASTWLDQVKSDPDVGGDKLPENAEAVTRLVDKYFDKSLKEYLDSTKLGNRPDVFKSLLRIAKDMKVMDDKAVKAPPQSRPTPRSKEEILYPTHFQEQTN